MVFVHGTGRCKPAEQREWGKLHGLLEKWEEYEKKLFAMGTTRNSYSKTDPDATFMHMKEEYMRNGQLKPGYNVQIVVNSAYITGVAAFSNRTGSGTLRPFLRRLEQQHGRKYRDIVADAGYESLDNDLYLEGSGQTSFIKSIHYEAQKTKKFRSQLGRRENMRYDEQENRYICAAGRKLVFRYESTCLDRQGYYQTTAYYRCESCANCPHREACCKAKDGKPKELQVKTDLLRINSQSQKNITAERGVILRIN